MLTLLRYSPLLCATALLACNSDRAGGDPLAPAFEYGIQLSQDASGPSASGHGNVIQQPSGAKRTFSFHARVMPDGSVQGEYDNHNRQGGFVNHGDIDCLRLIGTNGAVLSGPTKRSTNPNAPEGSTVVFRVEDNGEGGEGVDRMSMLAIFPPGSIEDCQVFTPPNTAPVVGGNIQVRP